MARVVVGQFRDRIVEVGTVATETRRVGARHHLKPLAVGADVVVGAFARVASNHIRTRAVILARIRLALVDFLITPVAQLTNQNRMSLVFFLNNDKMII